MAKIDFSKLARFVKLPSKAQLATPRGRVFSAVALVAASTLIVMLSTINPAGSNSPNGNRPGKGHLASGSGSTSDYQNNQAEPTPSDTPNENGPISGPQASAWASNQAQSEKEQAEQAERARISNLGSTDTFLLVAKITLDGYIAASEEVIKRGSTENKALAQDLGSAAKKVLAEVETLASSRKVEFAKLGIEPSSSDMQRLRADFMLSASKVDAVKNATDLDVNGNFSFIVMKSVADFASFADSRQMPDETEFKKLTALIKDLLGPIGKAYNR